MSLGRVVAKSMSRIGRTFLDFLTALVLIQLAFGIGTVKPALLNRASSYADPILVFTPNPANPGSFVEVTGTGFLGNQSECSIWSHSLNLFQRAPQCFAGTVGNITGIFQVNTNASQGVYPVFVRVVSLHYHEQYANGSITIVRPLPPPIELVTKTVSTIVSTTFSTTSPVTYVQTLITTATTTEVIRSNFTLPQMIATAAATATVVGVAFQIYVRHKLSMIRITAKRTGGRPGLAFDVEVKSGVDREQNPSDS